MKKNEVLKFLAFVKSVYPTLKVEQANVEAWVSLLCDVPAVQFQEMFVSNLKAGKYSGGFAPGLNDLFKDWASWCSRHIGDYDKDSEFGALCWAQAKQNVPDYPDRHQFDSPEHMAKSVHIRTQQQEKEFRRLYDAKQQDLRAQIALGTVESDALQLVFNQSANTVPAITCEKGRIGVSERNKKRRASSLYPSVKLTLEELVELLKGWRDLGISHHIPLDKLQRYLNVFPNYAEMDHCQVMKSDKFMSEIRAKWEGKINDDETRELTELIERLEERLAA